MQIDLKRTCSPNSFPRRLYRLLKENLLALIYSKRGMPCVVNGESFRILSRHRHVLTGQNDEILAKFLRERVKAGSVCVNVGANIGLYVLQFAKWTGSGGKVIAFEPSPDSVRVLRRHVEMNGFESRVRIVEAAVAERPGRAEFFMSGTNQMNRLGQPNPLLGHTEKTMVEVTSLDRFFQEENLIPDWILIDIEGFEIAALAGAVETIRQRGQNLGLVVEMHPNSWDVAGTRREELESLLEKLNLEPVPMNGQSDCLEDYGMVWLRQRQT